MGFRKIEQTKKELTMTKMLTKIMLLPLFSVLLIADDWQLDGIFKDYEMPRSNGYGIHGTVVAPDGNVWVAMHGPLAQDSIIINDTLSVYVRPIHVFTPSGEHASFSPIRFVTNDDGSQDTLTYSGKGMALDTDGNIIYATDHLYRFNYQSGEMMDKLAVPYDDAGSLSSLTAPSVDSDGNVYVSWVGGASRPVVKISSDFLTQSTVADAGVNYNRSTLVTPDAGRIFLGSTWGTGGIRVLEANFLGTAYDSVDTYGVIDHTWDVYDIAYDTTISGTDTTITADTTITSTTEPIDMWAEVLGWNLGVLWSGGTDPDWGVYYDEGTTSPHMYEGSWVGHNPNTGEIVDSFGNGGSLPADADASAFAAAGGTNGPRGLGVSADGLTMYVGDFNTNCIQVWTNSDPVTLSIEDESEKSISALGYSLHQAYPNPFNPTTTISYEVGRTGNATLEIFNLKGELVRTLATGWHFNGIHTAKWNGQDNNGLNVTSGTYIYRLSSSEVSFSKKVTFIK